MDVVSSSRMRIAACTGASSGRLLACASVRECHPTLLLATQSSDGRLMEGTIGLYGVADA
jgi:hypothetical protein